MLISFEGIDGCGKSTQINLLKNKLISENRKVASYREPGGTEISESIRSILLDKKNTIDPVTELLLFSSARSQLIAETVLPKLNDGYIVLLDRYFDSTTAYQGYGRSVLSINAIKKINAIASHQLVPELTFYLRIDFETAILRREGRESDRMESSGKIFFKKVIDGFDQLSKTESRFVQIDSTQDKLLVNNEIYGTVISRLG